MPDIELLGLLKVTCEVVEGQQADRKFNSQTIQLSNGRRCKANTDWEITSDTSDVLNANSKMPDFFRSSVNRAAKKSKPSINAKNTQ